MSCDCINRIEKQLLQKMVEKYPGYEVVEEPKFQNRTIILGDNALSLTLGNPVLGRVRKGKMIRKYDTQMLPSYCPFCGKKLREKEGGDQ